MNTSASKYPTIMFSRRQVQKKKLNPLVCLTCAATDKRRKSPKFVGSYFVIGCAGGCTHCPKFDPLAKPFVPAY